VPARAPWVGYWWPYTSNGIASGRYAGGYSPAGKYDAARGGGTQAQLWEVLNHGARVRGVGVPLLLRCAVAMQRLPRVRR
jgi:hypothetical protein